MTIIQDTDRFFVQRTSTKIKTNLALEGSQLRDYIEETQLNLNNEVVGDVEDLKLEVIQINSAIDLIIGDGGLIDELKLDISEEEAARIAADVVQDDTISQLDIRIQRLEEYSDIKGFYYIQPVDTFPGSNMLVGGMTFNNSQDDLITGIKLKSTDIRGNIFSYVNINEGEKIEIVNLDSNNTVRKRLLFNIESVTPPASNKAYVELSVTYLFSTGDKTLQDLIDAYDPDPLVPTSDYEVRVELFPAFDPSGTVTQSYVDNKVSDLDEELRKEIDNVKLTSGVSRIVAGQNITLSPSDGLGDVTITSSPVIQSYNLPAATTTSIGGVKVSGISGTTSNIIGIDSNKKLTIQDSTNNKKGANYKGQCCVQGSGQINSADYKQGQLIWHQGKGVLFLAT